jgi:tetratricopeptide (TPR) repeat protein
VPKWRRRIWVGVVGVAVIGVALAGVGLRDRARAEAACGEAGGSMVGVWDPGTPQMLDRAFVDTGAPNGEEVARLVASSLDVYAESWSSARRQACMDTVGQGAESVEVLGKRLSCLDLRREQMRQLVGLFLAPDAKVVQRAADAVSDLSPPSTCVSEEMLARLADDVTIEQIASAATTLSSAGKFESALTAAEEAVAVARQSENDAAEAHALTVLAGVQMELGRYEPAESSLHAAQVAAERAGRDDLVTGSQVRLVSLIGFRLGRHEEATRLAEQVEARLLRHARDRGMPEHRRLELEGELAYGTSLLLVAQGRYAEARDSFLRMLGLRKQAYGEDHPRVARAKAALGTVSNTLGEYAQGEVYLREALEMYERHFGRDHPEVGVTLLNLVLSLRSQARTEEALVEVARAKALWARAGGDKNIRYAQTLQLEASVLADADRLDEADAAFARAAEAFEKLEVPATASAPVLEDLGFLRLQQGRPAEAETMFAEFLRAMEGVLGEGHPATLDGLIGLGIARVDKGDAKGAKEVLTRAREIQDRAGTLATDGAQIDFAMARAIARDDPERARQLATRARDVYQANPSFRGQVPKIDAFLASLDGGR